MKKKTIFHPLLFALYPLLLLYSVNMDTMPFQEIFRPAIVSLGLVFIFWLVVAALTGRSLAAALVVSLFLLVFLVYGYLLVIASLKNPTPQWGRLLKHGTFQCALVVSLILISRQIIRTTRSLARVTNLINIASVCLILFNVLPWAARLVMGRMSAGVVERIPQRQIRAQGPTTRPHIFYIILDEYARSDVLKQLFLFDDSSFVDHLIHKSFYVAAHSRANYCQTYHSIASSLNLSYLDTMLRVTDLGSRSRLPLWRLIRKNDAAAFLKSQGYQFVAFSTGMSFTEVPDADVYVRPSWALSNFEYVLLLTTPIGQLSWLSRLQLELHRQRLLYTFERLPDFARNKTPVFVLAHILAPHSPFVYGANGEKVYYNDDFDSYAQAAMGDRASYVEKYRAQLLFVTWKIQRTIDAILDNSTDPPVIILQSDHGSGSRYNREDIKSTDLWERMSILNAYHLPGKGATELYSSITPVNTFRVVFNKYFGTGLALLEDRSYFAKWSRPYELVEITKGTDTHGREDPALKTTQ